MKSYFIATVGALFTLVLLCSCSKKQDQPTFEHLMNLGKAHLENREAKAAVDILSQAVRVNPKSTPALRNLARAFLLAQQLEEARTALGKADRLESNSPTTQYLMGLTYSRKSLFVQAIPIFERAVRLDPLTAALRFQLANAYDITRQREKAREQLEETLRLNPLHASAHFKLSSLARQDGDREAFQTHFQEFNRLQKLFGDETRSTVSLEQCLHTQAEPWRLTKLDARENHSQALKVIFHDDTSIFLPDPDPNPDPDLGPAHRQAMAISYLETNEAGDPVLAMVNPNGMVTLMTKSSDGVWSISPSGTRLENATTISQCLAGDFHNDAPAGTKYDPKLHALQDLLCLGSDRVYLLKRTGPGSFMDVTEVAGLSEVSANRALWVDFEHDGDLDLGLATQNGLEVWQNNGDGTFENVTQRIGLHETSATFDMVAIDFERNVAIDLVAACGDSPTRVYINQRVGKFKPLSQPPGPWPKAHRLLVNDLNNDATADVILIRQKHALILYTDSTRRTKLEWSDTLATSATLIDYDNDGWLDLLLTGKRSDDQQQGSLSLYRNLGTRWENVTQATGLSTLDLSAILEVIAVDLDRDQDSDLLLLTADGLRVLRNEGGHVHGQLKLRLTATKSNPSAFGTHLELRREKSFISRFYYGGPIEIGLAGLTKLDTVQMVWTNGVVDNEFNVEPATEPLHLIEKNVATGSCPFLYVWDGSRYRFVTDLLGNAPIGLPLSRTTLLPADPDEIVEIGPANHFPLKEGSIELVITDEFREVLYLDFVKVLAVDHPVAMEIHPTDKLMPAPFPDSALWALSHPRELVSSVSSDEVDRTADLRVLDDVFAPPGKLLPSPYRGMCEPLSITLDFGSLDSTRPLVLAMTGWLQYGDGSTNIAMSQNKMLTIIPPALEAQSVGGEWIAVDVVVGMPSGKTKTILTDLTGKLPAHTQRLRLTTTFEIRWDRIALFEREDPNSIQVHELLPDQADFRFRGFSPLLQRKPGHPSTPNFDRVSETPPWMTTLQGWCTRYGDVLELVTQRDEKLLLVNGGDAVTLRFPAKHLPPLPRGSTRTYFFYAVGWDKDGDHNVVDGDQVAPLPVGMKPINIDEASFDESDWRWRYNTRWVPRDQFRGSR